MLMTCSNCTYDLSCQWLITITRALPYNILNKSKSNKIVTNNPNTCTNLSNLDIITVNFSCEK